MLTLAIAALLAQSVEPKDDISDYVRVNIRNAVRSGNAGAVVTVVDANERTAKLHLDEVVQGELPSHIDVDVPVKTFAKGDLKRGTELLVFFRARPGSLTPTGQYELINDGKIREYERATYLERARWEASQVGRVKVAKQLATPKTVSMTRAHQ